MAKNAAYIPEPWLVKRRKVKLIQNKQKEWLLTFDNGSSLPATDALVNLWLDYCEVKAQLSSLQAQNTLSATN